MSHPGFEILQLQTAELKALCLHLPHARLRSAPPLHRFCPPQEARLPGKRPLPVFSSIHPFRSVGGAALRFLSGRSLITVCQKTCVDPTSSGTKLLGRLLLNSWVRGKELLWAVELLGWHLETTELRWSLSPWGMSVQDGAKQRKPRGRQRPDAATHICGSARIPERRPKKSLLA